MAVIKPGLVRFRHVDERFAEIKDGCASLFRPGDQEGLDSSRFGFEVLRRDDHQEKFHAVGTGLLQHAVENPQRKFTRRRVLQRYP